ncbi:MAG: tetratricopeptide repeat protein [bacterium]|nr:tetratricopeptide repeat protein [bacterium]
MLELPMQTATTNIVAQKLFNKGITAAQNQQPDTAIEYFSAAIDADTTWIEPHGHLAWQYFLNGEFDKAEKQYQAVLNLDKTNAEAWYRLGDCYLNLAHYQPAVEAYRQSYRLTPFDHEIVSRIKRLNQEYILEFIPGLEKELTPVFDIPATRSLFLAYLYYLLGSLAYLFRQRDQAIDYLLRARRRFQQNAHFYIQLGNAFLLSDRGYIDWATAESCFIRAVFIAPNLAAGRFSLGNFYAKTNQTDKAISEYSASILSSNYLAKLHLGNMYVKQGQYPLAIKQYKQAIEMKRDYLPVYINLGLVYEQMGYKQDAIEVYRTILPHSPQNSLATELLNYLGAIKIDTTLTGDLQGLFRSCYSGTRQRRLQLITIAQTLYAIRFKYFSNIKRLCPNCGISDYTFYFRHPKSLGTIVCCKECGLLFTAAPPSISVLAQRYQDEYWNEPRLEQRKKYIMQRSKIKPISIRFLWIY